MTQDKQNNRDRRDGNRDRRMAMGLGIGVALGVVLSLLLQSWGYMGVGVAVGLVLYGGMPLFGRRADPSTDSYDRNDD